MKKVYIIAFFSLLGFSASNAMNNNNNEVSYLLECPGGVIKEIVGHLFDKNMIEKIVQDAESLSVEKKTVFIQLNGITNLSLVCKKMRKLIQDNVLTASTKEWLKKVYERILIYGPIIERKYQHVCTEKSESGESCGKVIRGSIATVLRASLKKHLKKDHDMEWDTASAKADSSLGYLNDKFSKDIIITCPDCKKTLPQSNYTIIDASKRLFKHICRGKHSGPFDGQAEAKEYLINDLLDFETFHETKLVSIDKESRKKIAAETKAALLKEDSRPSKKSKTSINNNSQENYPIITTTTTTTTAASRASNSINNNNNADEEARHLENTYRMSKKRPFDEDSDDDFPSNPSKSTLSIKKAKKD